MQFVLKKWKESNKPALNILVGPFVCTWFNKSNTLALSGFQFGGKWAQMARSMPEVADPG